MDVSADASDEDIIMEDWDISASPQDLHPWPPRPTCEEERVSLAKEVGGQILIETLQNDDAVSRGTIDQTPYLDRDLLSALSISTNQPRPGNDFF